ncbi:hypothetical protein BGW80DRAFT_1306502 [Lactifluus volemus]|nr:hypothetical protein BGW80DRAFT_1306502 [Lactifluus volemus]
MWDYVGGARRLPVQWVSWLSHTRPDPPTIEELRADLERQRRVLHNAAVIQARDQEERARISAPESAVVENLSSRTQQGILMGGETDSRTCFAGNPEKSPPSPPQIHESKQPPQLSHDLELPHIGTDKDWQPETWTPQTARRRG